VHLAPGLGHDAVAVNCYGVNDGTFSWNQNTGRADSGDNFTIRDSYFHDLTHNAANGHIRRLPDRGRRARCH